MTPCHFTQCQLDENHSTESQLAELVIFLWVVWIVTWLNQFKEGIGATSGEEMFWLGKVKWGDESLVSLSWMNR